MCSSLQHGYCVRVNTTKRHRQLRVKDMSKVPMWWPEWDSNSRPCGRKALTYHWATTRHEWKGPSIYYICNEERGIWCRRFWFRVRVGMAREKMTAPRWWYLYVALASIMCSDIELNGMLLNDEIFVYFNRWWHSDDCIWLRWLHLEGYTEMTSLIDDGTWTMSNRLWHLDDGIYRWLHL